MPKKLFLDYLKNLNKAQREAVTYLDGPLLIVAGAGSGKTKVLTTRIANIIKEKNDNFKLHGTSGEILVEPLLVKHGDIDALGFKINKMAYIPDISDFYQDTFSKLYNLDILIIDALRRNPHPAHAHLEKTLNWIEKLKPKKAILTNMHNDLDYEAIKQETPENVEPAHDGLIINL